MKITRSNVVMCTIAVCSLAIAGQALAELQRTRNFATATKSVSAFASQPNLQKAMEALDSMSDREVDQLAKSPEKLAEWLKGKGVELAEGSSVSLVSSDQELEANTDGSTRLIRNKYIGYYVPSALGKHLVKLGYIVEWSGI